MQLGLIVVILRNGGWNCIKAWLNSISKEGKRLEIRCVSWKMQNGCVRGGVSEGIWHTLLYILEFI